MSILVLLHVEINELGLSHAIDIGVGIVDSRLIKFRHATDKFREAFLIVQGVCLRINAGNLDRDIVDVRFLEGL